MAKSSLKNHGSLFNYLMSNNKSVPVVGEGATIMLYSDRNAYEVVDVSKDGKTVKIQQYLRKPKFKGMTDEQDYIYDELLPNIYTLKFRYGSWYIQSSTVEFTKEYIEANTINGVFRLPKDNNITYSNYGRMDIIEGVTKEVIVYSKVNIIFGVKSEYYDYSF